MIVCRISLNLVFPGNCVRMHGRVSCAVVQDFDVKISCFLENSDLAEGIKCHYRSPESLEVHVYIDVIIKVRLFLYLCPFCLKVGMCVWVYACLQTHVYVCVCACVLLCVHL